MSPSVVLLPLAGAFEPAAALLFEVLPGHAAPPSHVLYQNQSGGRQHEIKKRMLHRCKSLPLP